MERIQARALRTFLTLTLAIAAGDASSQTTVRSNAMPVSPAAVTAAPSGSGLLLGQVVDADTGRPVAGAVVTLGGGPPVQIAQATAGGQPSPQPTSLTNAQGHFLFRDLAKSTYTLSMQAPGYLNSSYGQRRPDGGPSRSVDLADGQRAIDVVIRAWRVGVITGRIVDETGDPVVNTTVRAVRKEGGGRLTMGFQAPTDDRGIYRLANLVPGEYLVMLPSTFTSVPSALTGSLSNTTAALNSPLSRDVPGLLGFALGGGVAAIVNGMAVLPGLTGGSNANLPPPKANERIKAYPTTFHPAALTPDAAVTVRVASGAERSGVDLQLTLMPMFSVSGIVEGPTGPMPTMGIRLVPAFGSALSNDSNVETAVTATGPDGRFTFLGVPAGQYDAKALRVPRPTAPPSVQTVISLDGGGGMVSFGSASPNLPAIPDEPTYWVRCPSPCPTAT